MCIHRDFLRGRCIRMSDRDTGGFASLGKHRRTASPRPPTPGEPPPPAVSRAILRSLTSSVDPCRRRSPGPASSDNEGDEGRRHAKVWKRDSLFVDVGSFLTSERKRKRDDSVVVARVCRRNDKALSRRARQASRIAELSSLSSGLRRDIAFLEFIRSRRYSLPRRGVQTWTGSVD